MGEEGSDTVLQREGGEGEDRQRKETDLDSGLPATSHPAMLLPTSHAAAAEAQVVDPC